MVGVYINGDSNRFLHNTVHHSSASAFIAPGTSPEFAYNEVLQQVHYNLMDLFIKVHSYSSKLKYTS